MNWAAFSGWELLHVIFIDVIWEIGVWLKIFQWWHMQLFLQVLLLQAAPDLSHLFILIYHTILLRSLFVPASWCAWNVVMHSLQTCGSFKFISFCLLLTVLSTVPPGSWWTCNNFHIFWTVCKKTALAHWWENQSGRLAQTLHYTACSDLIVLQYCTMVQALHAFFFYAFWTILLDQPSSENSKFFHPKQLKKHSWSILSTRFQTY